MKTLKQTITAIVAVAAVGATLVAMAPAALAAEEPGVVSSVRSFPKTTSARKDLLSESTSTDVEQDSNWGGIESLDVPQTKSQAEKDAEKAAQEAAEAAAQAEAEAQAQAASRSASRSSISSGESFTTTPPDGQTASDLVNYAMQFVGRPYLWGGTTPDGWDCSGFVMYVYAQFGISLPHSSGAMMSMGRAVSSLAEAQPGDILCNSGHAAICIGNGMVINALNVGQGTQVSPPYFTGSYVIRRLL